MDFDRLVAARRYDDAIRELRSLLCASDPGSCFAARRFVARMLHSAASGLLRSACNGSLQEKLDLLDFFLECFSETCDIEGQLVIQYEILKLREAYSAGYPGISTTADEWLAFGQECIKCGFFSNAAKAFEAATKDPQAREEAFKERDLTVLNAGETTIQSEAIHRLQQAWVPSSLQSPQRAESSHGSAEFLANIRRRNKQRLDASMLRAN